MNEIQQLLVLGIDLNFQEGVHQDTPLTLCCYKAHKELLRDFLTLQSVDLTVADANGYTALHQAVMFAKSCADAEVMVDQILSTQNCKKPANVNQKDKNGSSVLHHAIQKFGNNSEATNIMKKLNKNADWSQTNNAGKIPIEMISSVHQHIRDTIASLRS